MDPPDVVDPPDVGPDPDVPPLEVGGLQDLFFNVLSSSTGRSLEDLTTGSRLLGKTPDPVSQ